jgi:hypothetical protein
MVRDIGQSLMLLKKGLEGVHEWSSDWKAKSFLVFVSGWQWSRKRVRPLIAWVGKPRNALSIELGYTRRHWYWERDQGKRFRFIVGAEPATNLSDAQRKAMAEKLAGCNADQAERVMVDVIREVSRSVPEVGPHCMSVLLRPPALFGARIRYIPLDGPALAVVSASDGPTFTVPAAFTPWIVGPGVTLPPSLIAGQWSVQIGHYTIAFEAPGLPGPGVEGERPTGSTLSPKGLFCSRRRPKRP